MSEAHVRRQVCLDPLETHEWLMARFCKRVLVIKDGLLVRDEPVKDRLCADEELAKVREVDALDEVMGPY